MARRREHLSAYLRICVSGRQQNHKKIEKVQERIIRYRLKKNVPAGSNAYLRICYFLKKSQPYAPVRWHHLPALISSYLAGDNTSSKKLPATKDSTV
jgi:hypothetical protein